MTNIKINLGCFELTTTEDPYDIAQIDYVGRYSSKTRIVNYTYVGDGKYTINIDAESVYELPDYSEEELKKLIKCLLFLTETLLLDNGEKLQFHKAVDLDGNEMDISSIDKFFTDEEEEDDEDEEQK